MSEYSELIKRFDKIRDYMRDFFVYGFKSRVDYDRKSLRSYDNEKRRIEGYIAPYMSFQQNESGKNIFLSVDTSEILANPLYRAFKAKTFTKNDITLNFLILDILTDEVALNANEILNKIVEDYLSNFEEPISLDLSTIRNKLNEYVRLGILNTEKQGKKQMFFRETTTISLNELSDALVFFSETSPLGVVGSYLLDCCAPQVSSISFKHHYIMHALESEILYELIEALHHKRNVEIINHSPRMDKEVSLKILPLKILISVQGGRRYLSAYCFKSKAILNFRLDYIRKVLLLEENEDFDFHKEKLYDLLENAWGVSFGRGHKLEHLRLTLSIQQHERFMIERIEREGRNGRLTKIDDSTYLYEIDVYDSTEMIPWLRTFIGRIISLECDNESVSRTFYKDLDALYAMYDGGADDVI